MGARPGLRFVRELASVSAACCSRRHSLIQAIKGRPWGRG